MNTNRTTNDEILQALKKLDAKVDGFQAELRDLRETVSRLETEKAFDRTIGRIGFRPESRSMEPSGDYLVEYTSDFRRYPSPYRR